MQFPRGLPEGPQLHVHIFGRAALQAALKPALPMGLHCLLPCSARRPIHRTRAAVGMGGRAGFGGTAPGRKGLRKR